MNHSFLSNRLFLLLLLPLFAFGCKTTDQTLSTTSDPQLAPSLIRDIDLTGGKVLFNLAQGEIVPGMLEDTGSWDIAFEQASLLVKKGGQLLHVSFDQIEEAPADGYTMNSSSAGTEITDGMGKSWFNYNTSTHVVSALPDRTFIILTDKGQYAKLQILDYYKQEEPQKEAPRFLTFRYALQEDGSQRLNSVPNPELSTPEAPTSITQ